MKIHYFLILLLSLGSLHLLAQQTPKSFSFQGVAKNADGIVSGGIGLQFTIQQGEGTYEVDWEVKGVRKEYENYEVVRHKSYCEPAAATAEK